MSARKRRVIRVGALTLSGLFVLAPGAHAILQRPPAAVSRITLEAFSQGGRITPVSVKVSAEEAATPTELDSSVTPIQISGPSSNRFDIVIVGDGYTQGQLGLFHEHALAKWATIKSYEPFKTYANYFNVWMVDVVSNESGVDSDPVPGIMKDTALDMQFWCSGTERLLCMNNTKAGQYAALPPDADQVLGLANSTKYGGAGGAYATSSGGNAAAGDITVHELGHSIGHLADEYDYYYRAGLSEDSDDDVKIPAPYVLYTGSEPGQYNISAADQTEMAAGKIKWWRWLGEASPDGGTVGTYEGGGYYKMGMYRPTMDSIMHSLGGPYNLPGLEKMTQSFYEHMRPIDSAPPTDVPLDGVSPVSIALVQPDHPLTVDWFLDGALVETAHNQTTFEFPADSDASELTVRVIDETSFVRDPGWIADYLTQSLTWSIN
jgi:hypothetical protein